MSTYKISSEPIESQIIAYFDGKLSDHESAELMHRVSVSPEIRDLFQQHEALRGLAYRSARNISVPASLEESLFARISGTDREKALPLAFWNLRRISTVAAGFAVLLAMVASSLEFKNARWQSTNSVPASNVNENIAPVLEPSSDVAANAGSEVKFSSALIPARSYSTDRSNGNGSANDNPPASENSIAVTEDAPAILLSPAPRESSGEQARINMPGVGNQPIASLQTLASEVGNSPWEFSFATSASGFASPVVTLSPQFISDFTLRGGYSLDANDEVGLSFSRTTAFANLNSVPSQQVGFIDVTRVFNNLPQYAEEIYYQRRDPIIINNALIYITERIAGGMYSNGSVIGADAGIEIPVSNHLLGGISVELNRLHQTNSGTYSQPVIFEGPNIYNSFSGTIQYSMSYRF